MADLRGQQLKDSYQDVITDSGSDLAGIENGNGIDITARVVERGSNSDGEWVRFADGTQIIQALVPSTSVTMDSTSTGDFQRSSVFGYSYPVDFSHSPVVFGAQSQPFGFGVLAVAGGSASNEAPRLDTYQIRYAVPSSSSESTNCSPVSVIAKGRWK